MTTSAHAPASALHRRVWAARLLLPVVVIITEIITAPFAKGTFVLSTPLPKLPAVKPVELG